MVNYKEILRLASEDHSQRQIAISVGSSRNTVSEVIKAAKANGNKPISGTRLCLHPCRII